MDTIPSHHPSNQIRFLILGRQRVGSNHLISLLNNHPDIAAFGEIFSSPNRVSWGTGSKHEVSELLPAEGPDTVAERDADPVAFVERHVFGEVTAPYRASGFKFFYDHADFPAGHTIREWLLSHPDIRVIHLKRRNTLRTFVSKRLANVSGTYVQYKKADPPESPLSTIEIKRSDFKKFFERALIEERDADYMFRNHSVFTVWYEDLADNPDGVTAAILTFLQQSVRPLQSILTKQNTKPLKMTIENYEDLKESLSNSPILQFFED